MFQIQLFLLQIKMKINILYWDNGDKQRLDNTNLSWYNLKSFADYCNDNGVAVEPFLFDFSEVQVLPDAIHIPYPKGDYKRSEKINKVFAHHAGEETFLAICDSDVIIRPEDYDAMMYFIVTVKKNKYYVFKVDDLTSVKGVDFENNKINFDELETQPRQFEPDLGGLFMLHNDIIKTAGGFDERFTVWGGEDNEISYRLQGNGFSKILLPVVPIHLPHDHALLEKDLEQYKKQVQILGL